MQSVWRGEYELYTCVQVVQDGLKYVDIDKCSEKFKKSRTGKKCCVFERKSLNHYP